MIDPLVSLAFSMHNAKGVYAILLGSGVSTAAGIPTGWGIILDIIRKVSEAYGEPCEPEPEKWYQQKFGEPPSYSKLLDQLGKTASERNTFLRPYIEPTTEEREQNLKVPSKAHHAIARLAAADYIKVILTTNFDRLMESALEAAGVSPTVIASADAVAGATPLTHATCTVIKLHGDYLDTRIKNTPDELAVYDERLNKLLDRVLDEYGLIVCGWSADWDDALRAAFERCPNRRYTTYWAARGRPSEKAQALIAHRQAQVITIDGADGFFEGLAERVFALESLAQPHPLTTATAVAMLKKYLPDPQQVIRLHDLMTEQTERLVERLTDKDFDPNVTPTEELIWSRMQRYEVSSETLMALMATGCYWGTSKQEHLWVQTLNRVSNAVPLHGGFLAWDGLQLYPALLLEYCGGIAALAKGKYKTFLYLLTGFNVRSNQGDEKIAIEAIRTWSVLHRDIAKKMPDYLNRYTGLSDHLHKLLREPFRPFLPDGIEYDRLFDRFEYVCSLVNFDLNYGGAKKGLISPGRFVWRRHGRYDVFMDVQTEAEEMRESWPPLTAGLFNGSYDRFVEVKKVHDERMYSLGWD